MLMNRERGFTLIELLTVIAIIAILAAIIFPVMSSARRQARKTQCMSNMRQISTAVRLFQQDERRYPDFLAGPVQFDASYNPLPLDQTNGMYGNQLVSLYPEYIKSAAAFKCPDSIVNGDGEEYSMTDLIADPMYYQLRNVLGITNALRATDNGSGQPFFYLYKYSSYDYQKPKNTIIDEAHYSTIWSNEPTTTPGVERQLRWRTPPEDTVITWCSFHRDVDASGIPGAGSREVVLFLDGRVQLLDSVLFTDWTQVWSRAQPRS